jgi:hypothetical protein
MLRLSEEQLLQAQMNAVGREVDVLPNGSYIDGIDILLTPTIAPVQVSISDKVNDGNPVNGAASELLREPQDGELTPQDGEVKPQDDNVQNVNVQNDKLSAPLASDEPASEKTNLPGINVIGLADALCPWEVSGQTDSYVWQNKTSASGYRNNQQAKPCRVGLRKPIINNGGRIDWDSTTKKATVRLHGNVIEVWNGRNMLKVNGHQWRLTEAPDISKGRLCLNSNDISQMLSMLGSSENRQQARH